MQTEKPNLVEHASAVNLKISKALRHPAARFWPSELTEALTMTGDMLHRIAVSIEKGQAGGPHVAGTHEDKPHG